MIRIRVSTLESFRRTTEWEADETELVEYIKAGQTSAPNWKMAAGTAWHKVLECPASTVNLRTEQHAHGGFSFPSAAVYDACDLVGPGRHEVTAVKRCEGVEIKGTADHVHGLRLTDNKTKFSAPDAKDYERSAQWRFYLWLHDCWEFRYVLWPMKDPDGPDNEGGLVVPKGEPMVFSFYRYPDMVSECRELVREFLFWAQARNLLPFLEDRR